MPPYPAIEAMARCWQCAYIKNAPSPCRLLVDSNALARGIRLFRRKFVHAFVNPVVLDSSRNMYSEVKFGELKGMKSQ